MLGRRDGTVFKKPVLLGRERDVDELFARGLDVV